MTCQSDWLSEHDKYADRVQFDQLIQRMQGNHRGSASGMMAAGAPDEHLPVPSAMYGTTYRMDPNNQPTFVPGEEKAGVDPQAAWGDDSEDEV